MNRSADDAVTSVQIKRQQMLLANLPLRTSAVVADVAVLLWWCACLQFYTQCIGSGFTLYI